MWHQLCSKRWLARNTCLSIPLCFILKCTMIKCYLDKGLLLLGYAWSNITGRPWQTEVLGENVYPHLNLSLHLWKKVSYSKHQEAYITTLYFIFTTKNIMPSWCCFNLGQVWLVGAAQGSGLHMLWYQTLVSQDMQGQSLTGWAHVWVDHRACLCKEHKGSQKCSKERIS